MHSEGITMGDLAYSQAQDNMYRERANRERIERLESRISSLEDMIDNMKVDLERILDAL